MTSLLPSPLSFRLESKLARLAKLRPFSAAMVAKLREQFCLEMTHHSTAIEGNSLTMQETFLVINEGLTVRGKPLKDHLEVHDHQQSLELLYELVTDQQPTLSEHLIRSIHQMVMKKTDEYNAGRYRTGKVMIGGTDHLPPPPALIPDEMQKLLTWFGEQQTVLSPIDLAATLHHKLVYIHPFFDGNGRTARLLLNLVVLRAGYPLVIFLKHDRKAYYQALHAADKGDLSVLVRFVGRAVERSLDIYLETLEPNQKQEDTYLLLSDISSSTVYSAKYLNLLVRQGKLEAYKQNRNWVTTLSAVKRYTDSRIRQRQVKNKTISTKLKQNDT